MPPQRPERSAFLGGVAVCIILMSVLFFQPARAGDEPLIPGLNLAVMLDARAIASSRTQSYFDRGIGITQFGADRAGRRRLLLDIPTAAFLVNYRLSYDLSFESHWRASGSSRTRLDAIEAFLRYAPVSTDIVKFQFRAGAFLPPAGLSETAFAWTSAYNLTPSALSSWLGEEIKILGVEGAAQWRLDADRIDLRLGVYGGNDPAGVTIAGRGFSFSDTLPGLFDPRAQMPSGYVNELRQLNNHYGGYAGLTYKRPDMFTLRGFAYDNFADPRAVRDGRAAWRTRFFTFSAEVPLPFDLTVIAEVLTGTTRINPIPTFLLDVKFDTASILVAQDYGPHRLSLRAEEFRVSDRNRLGPIGNDQHGHAFTAAYITWLNKDLRLTLEQLVVQSADRRRLRLGFAEIQDELQIQGSLRYYFRP